MKKKLLLVVLMLLVGSVVLASGTDMPWETPLEEIMKSLTGPVAKILAILSVAGCGIAMAFGEMGGAMKKLVNIVFGISIVFAAATFVPSFFGFSGGINF